MSDGPLQCGLGLLPPSFEPWDGTGSGREIAVLMSGGVDSSVAALLLQEAGWKVLGVTMKIPVAEACDHPRPCCGADAAVVCHKLGIPHYFIEVGRAFQELVIEPFRRAYLEGHTPNPCVDCNTRLKFALVWDLIEATFGIRRLATGHYARVLNGGGRAHLARGTDRRRDQSYFIYGIPRERLAGFALPVGELSKARTRQIARERGLPIADKADSQELCFAGEANYRRALAGAARLRPGPILDTSGSVIGRHDGIVNFTLGQRRGLRIARGEPQYVVRISPGDRSITIGTRAEASRRRVEASSVNALIPEQLHEGARLFGKTRSVGEPSPCTVAAASDAGVAVEFDEPQFAPAPGQRLVLYDADARVVAGGTIVLKDSDPRFSRAEVVARRGSERMERKQDHGRQATSALSQGR